MDKSKKRKRTKVECLTCGSVFDDDYKTRHEIKEHAGKKVLVKHFGAPENPFTAAAAIAKQKNDRAHSEKNKFECHEIEECTSNHKSPSLTSNSIQMNSASEDEQNKTKLLVCTYLY
nr:uncharacterized protein LOC124813169 [Hydra vulgaris]